MTLKGVSAVFCCFGRLLAVTEASAVCRNTNVCLHVARSNEGGFKTLKKWIFPFLSACVTYISSSHPHRGRRGGISHA